MMRPRRTLLFVPGDQPHRCERAARSRADVVVLDLEDDVAPDRKAVGREGVAAALRDVDYGSAERVVRLNPGPGLERDLEAAAGADAVLLPKVEAPADLARLRDAARRALGAVPPVIALTAETALGALHASALVGAGDGVIAWMWGSEDLAGSVGCQARGRREAFHGPLALARATTVLLASAGGTQAIDTVYPFYRDRAGLRAEAATAAAAGFSGKAIIHPDQVAPVHDAFTPKDDEVERARAVTEAFATGASVVTLDGQMLDLPHLRAARLTISRAGRT